MIKIIDGDVVYAVCGYKEERIREALRVTLFPKQPATPTPPAVEKHSFGTPPTNYRWVPQGELIKVNDLIWHGDHWGYLREDLIGTPALQHVCVRKI